MSKQKYFYDCLDKEDVEKLNWTFTEDGNAKIVETAGFIPLEVKFKQFEQNGIIAQFHVSDFTSNDYRDIYLNPDFDITPEDEFEDIQEKLKARTDYVESLKKQKPGKQEPDKEIEKEPAEPVNDE